MYYAYKYVYEQGPALQSRWVPFSDTIQKIFKDDLQERLLKSAGEFMPEPGIVHVVLATNVLYYGIVQHDDSGTVVLNEIAQLTEKSQEFYLGKAIITRASLAENTYEIVRAKVPKFLYMNEPSLPDFKEIQ